MVSVIVTVTTHSFLFLFFGLDNTEMSLQRGWTPVGVGTLEGKALSGSWKDFVLGPRGTSDHRDTWRGVTGRNSCFVT